MEPDKSGQGGESAIRRARLRRAAGSVAGMLVLAAAVWAVASQKATLESAWASLRSTPAWMIGLLVLLPAGNLLASAGVLALLMRRHGRVGLAEMTALVAAAWLLNYLPLRPGLIGRVTYHKVFHGIGVAASLGVVLEAITCGAVAVVLLIAAGAVVARLESGPAAWLVALTPGLVAAVASAGLRGANRMRAAAVAVRYADTLLWVLRYLLVFEAIGVPVGFVQAAGAAAVSQAVLLVPIVGNGLGLREWAVGAVSSAMPAVEKGARVTITAGLAADLLNRALEVLAAVPIGLAGVAYLSRRVRRARREASGAPPIKPGSESAEPRGGRAG